MVVVIVAMLVTMRSPTKKTLSSDHVKDDHDEHCFASGVGGLFNFSHGGICIQGCCPVFTKLLSLLGCATLH